MLIPLMLLAMAQDSGRVDAMLATYRARTEADAHCRAAKGDEIMVCSRREADRYRVPFVLPPNASNSVPLRTAELTRDVSVPKCGEGAFLRDCGKVGVSATTSFGPGAGSGKTRFATLRELAP